MQTTFSFCRLSFPVKRGATQNHYCYYISPFFFFILDVARIKILTWHPVLFVSFPRIVSFHVFRISLRVSSEKHEITLRRIKKLAFMSSFHIEKNMVSLISPGLAKGCLNFDNRIKQNMNILGYFIMFLFGWTDISHTYSTSSFANPSVLFLKWYYSRSVLEISCDKLVQHVVFNTVSASFGPLWNGKKFSSCFYHFIDPADDTKIAMHLELLVAPLFWELIYRFLFQKPNLEIVMSSRSA